MKHTKLSARSKHLWGAAGMALFIVIILGALMLGIIIAEIIKVIQRRKQQKVVNDEFSDR